MEVTTIGIDLAKNVFALSGADERGKVVMRKRLRRGRVLPLLRELKLCLVGMESCGGVEARSVEGTQARAAQQPSGELRP
jgi:transposase